MKEYLISAIDKYKISLSDEQINQLQGYYEMLIEWNQKMNLTAITDPKEVAIKHFADSLSIFNYIDLPQNARIIDVGTGAGFPGVVIKIARPDLELTLIERIKKRLVFCVFSNNCPIFVANKKHKGMKFVSWNVNGLRACEGKGFSDIFRELDADFFCLQETKMQEGQLDLQFDGYESYWNYAEKKGYSGTAIFTKHKPLNVTYGIGIDEHDHEGRVITLEMDDFYLVTCYTPNSQDGLKRLDYRMTWEDDFRKYLMALDQKKPVILCGDLNVAHEEIDLKNPKTNRMNAGFTDQEREKFTTLLESGFTDSFRYKYPEQVTYSWWSYRFQARQKNAGWRIDYFVISNRLRERMDDAKIHTEILGSDHCPVELTIV